MYWLIHIVDMSIRLLGYSDKQACRLSRDSLWVFTLQTVISHVGNIFLQCFLKRSGLILVSAELLPSGSAFFLGLFTLFHVSIFLLSSERLLVSTVSLLAMFLLPLSCKVLACIVFYSSTFFLINAKPRSHSWAAPKCMDKGDRQLNSSTVGDTRGRSGPNGWNVLWKCLFPWLKRRVRAGNLLLHGPIKLMIWKGINSGLDMTPFFLHLSSHIQRNP